MSKEKIKKDKVKPVMKFTDYPVSATIWKKDIKVEKKTITVYNTELVCNYKDDDEEYQKTSSFKELDLLKASQLCQKAYNWICNSKQKDYESKNKDSDNDDNDESEDEE